MAGAAFMEWLFQPVSCTSFDGDGVVFNLFEHLSLVKNSAKVIRINVVLRFVKGLLEYTEIAENSSEDINWRM